MRADILQVARSFAKAHGDYVGAYRSGMYYCPTGVPGTAAGGLNSLRASYLPIPNPVTATSIGIEVTTLGTGALIRLGIYTDTDGYPGALILDAGQVDASTTGFKEVTISQALGVGGVWLAAVSQGTSDATVRVITGFSKPGIGTLNPGSLASGGMAGVAQSGVTAALPASFTAGSGAISGAPRVFLKVA